MRQYLGSIVFFLSVLVSVLGVATHWPWPAWALVVIATTFLLGAVLTFPVRTQIEVRSSFVEGDASGSIFGNVYTDATTFIHGDARQALFWNIIHRSESSKGK
jgi:hypothetical protein